MLSTENNRVTRDALRREVMRASTALQKESRWALERARECVSLLERVVARDKGALAEIEDNHLQQSAACFDLSVPCGELIDALRHWQEMADSLEIAERELEASEDREEVCNGIVE